MVSDISDIILEDSEAILPRRTLLAGLLGFAIASVLPSDAEARASYNVSYGLVKDDAGLAQLKQRYQSLMATSLKSEFSGKLVIEKTSHGNYALVFKVGKDKKAAFRIAKRHKEVSGIDASIRKVCDCEVVYPGAGHTSKPSPAKLQPKTDTKPYEKPADAPILQPKTNPVTKKVELKVTDIEDVMPDEPAGEYKSKPDAQPRPVLPKNIPSRLTNDSNYVQYSAINFDNLEDMLVKQQALEVRTGNLSSGDMVMCYVYDRSSGNMPVMLNSDRRIPELGNAVAKLGKVVITGKEKLSNNTAEGIADFISLIHDYVSLDRKKNRAYVAPRKGLLAATIPGDVRSLSETVDARNMIADASVILAEKMVGSEKFYHTYVVVMAIQGKHAASKEKYPAVMGRFSRLVYEAMRSRYPLL